MDWIELPMGFHGFDMVLVVIDRTTRMVHLMATRKQPTYCSTMYLSTMAYLEVLFPTAIQGYY